MRSLWLKLKFVWLIARIAYRFFSGRPMSGERKTDATFFRPATRSLDPSGHALRWEMMRGVARLAWRLVGLYVLLFLTSLPVVWLLSHEMAGRILTWHAVVVGFSLTGYVSRKLIIEYGLSLPVPLREESEREGERVALWRVRILPVVVGRRAWERRVVLPTAAAVAPQIQRSARPREVRKWLTVPHSYRHENGKPVEILLPQHFTGIDQKANDRIVRTVAGKLGMRDPDASWQLEGEFPRLILRTATLPPTKVLFGDVRTWLENSEEFRPFLGLMGESKGFHAEMIGDSPHIGLSAGPGAGKSTLAKLIIMQVLRWGWGVVICDWKMTEAYKWAIGLPGVIYITGIEEIHDMGVRVGEEVDIRKRAGMEGRARVLVVRDEWNATADLLMAYWQDLRATADPEEKKTMPLKSPALRGYAALDFAGREFGLFDLLIAQRFSSRIFNGNADMRECFNIKLLARYSQQTKMMLVGNMKPFPKKSNVPGRWTVVAGEDVAVIQVPLISGDEAREYAQGGLDNPLTPFSSSYRTQLDDMRTTQGKELRPDATGRNETLPYVDGQVIESPKTYKLSQLPDQLIDLGITYEMLRNATRSGDKGDPDFPSPYGGNPARGYTYRVDEVRAWARRRHASQRAEKEIAK